MDASAHRKTPQSIQTEAENSVVPLSFTANGGALIRIPMICAALITGANPVLRYS